MNATKIALLNILLSLAFAGVMIISGYFLEGTSWDRKEVTYLLMALWFLPFSYLSSKAGMAKERLERDKDKSDPE